jgi:hypothetical protein
MDTAFACRLCSAQPMILTQADDLRSSLLESPSTIPPTGGCLSMSGVCASYCTCAGKCTLLVE